MENIIELKNLAIEYKLKDYALRAVDGVDLNIKRGKITALVGESGSGKTTIVSSILRNISSPGEVVAGDVLFYPAGEEAPVRVPDLNKKELMHFRWSRVSMVFQASQSTLNPIMKIGEQFYETAYYHGEKRKYKEYKRVIAEKLAMVKLDPATVIDSYPHELSGGMKQRVMIAFAMLLDPDVIILDEPTTALDVITQHFIFDILSDINKERGVTMILLTHDIGVVAKVADYIGVMYAGRLMEYGSVYDVFGKKLHPYTQGLINATPSLIADLDRIEAIGGAAPNLLELPSGCVFHPRCKKAWDKCAASVPETVEVMGECVKCHLYGPKKEDDAPC